MRTIRTATKHGENLLFIPLFIGMILGAGLYMISPLSPLLIMVGLGIGLVLLFTHPFGEVLVTDEDATYPTLPLETNS